MIRYIGLVLGVAVCCELLELSERSETLMGFLFR